MKIINAVKRATKPHLSKEERDAKKQKLQEERAAKKAARIAKREARKQKEAERKAAMKVKREERAAKKAARLLKEKERKEARKLLLKEKKEARLAAREAKKLEKKTNREKKSELKKLEAGETKALTPQEKLEAERNEWKALSAIRRYVKDNAKILAALPEEKRAKKIKKLEKMGYTIGVSEEGVVNSIGYSFTTDVKIPQVKNLTKKGEKKILEKEEAEVLVPEKVEEDENLLTDAEIIEASKQDKNSPVEEILAGDTFKDETEIFEEDSLKNSNEDYLDDDDDDDDDCLFGRDDDISSEELEYRRDAFREMESNGAWD